METPDVAQSATALRTPDDIGEITPAWLTAAFRSRLPDVTVTAAEPVTVLRGTSTKVRFRLQSSGGELPDTVVVKTGFEPHSQSMESMYFQEMRAYRDVIPAFGSNAPKCYFAGADERGQTIIILEDLAARDVSFCTLRAPLGYERVKAFLSVFARLHARFWNAPELQAAGALADLPEAMYGRYERYILRVTEPSIYAQWVALPRGGAVPCFLHDPARLRRALFALRETYVGQPRTYYVQANVDF